MATTNDMVAGDYQLQDVVLFGQMLPRLSIRRMMVELNIYESINTPYMSGNVIIADTMNHRSNMSITGQEEIEFTLRTNDTSDFIDFTTHRARIYKISNIIPVSNTEQTYTLHFVSIDAMRNSQLRVKGAYKGSSDQIIAKVMSETIKTSKSLSVEESNKFLHLQGNNMYPFEFIRMAAKKSISTQHNAVSYSFFENHRGYIFSSKSALFKKNRVEDRDVVERFHTAYQRPRVDTPEEMKTLKSVSIVSTQDTIRDNANGLLNNTHYTYNRTNKSFSKSISSYETYINRTTLSGSPLYTGTPEIDDKGITDFPDSTISVSSKDPYINTQSTGDTTDYSNTGELQPDQFRGTSSYGIKLKIEMQGNSNIAAGDIIHITMPNFEPITNASDEKTYDVFLTGNYLVESINHRVDNNAYVTTCEVIRNSVETTYESNDQSIAENNKNRYKTPTSVVNRL